MLPPLSLSLSSLSLSLFSSLSSLSVSLSVSLCLSLSFSPLLSGDKETGHRVMTVMGTLGPLPDRQQEITYTDLKVIGSGSFGVVYQAKLMETNEPIAIKKVLQDKRFKVQILVIF